MKPFRLLFASIRDLGVAGTLDGLPFYLISPLTMRRLKRRKAKQLAEDGFDEAHGTDTAEILVGHELGRSAGRGEHLVSHYETTSVGAIRSALDGLAIDFADFAFVDLGCGKGKPLMVAASYPFRELIGVDISPMCIVAARRNIARYEPEKIDPSRIVLLNQDAEDFEFPDEPMVIYLFNPFPGAVLERVMANLERSLRKKPRRAVIVYVNPHALAAIVGSGLFVRIPTIADRMPMAADGTPRYEQAAVFATAPADWASPAKA
jgi:SAM-dependent methyltransferase